MKGLRRCVVALCVAGMAAAAWTGAAAGATFVVDKTGDASGEACSAALNDCSLRSALQNANAAAGTDTISFSVAGVIAPTSQLPVVTDPAIIDGTTAPGYVGPPVVGLDGAAAGFGAVGLYVTGGGTTIKGLSIVNFSFDGIRFESGGGNTVVGNWIGVDLSGLPAGNDGYGVEIRLGSANNTVGGAGAGRNVISANGLVGATFSGVGVFGAGTDGTVVSGNFIGTDTAGSADAGYGNGYSGVLMVQSGSNFIGGLGVGNVISRNGVAGVVLDRETSDTVLNNMIGTNAAGDVEAPNRGDGIWILGAGGVGTGTTIGGTTGANARNVISGNAGAGVRVSNADTTAIEGNYIGTDASGTADFGNAFGVFVEGPGNTTVGAGSLGGPGLNVISGNDVGAVFQNGATGNNIVNNNAIGPDASGAAGIGNGTGVWVRDTSYASIGENTVNTIAFNAGIGVKVETTSGIAKVNGNDIYANGGLGIDLGGDGVTANDAGDGDSGPNGRQNFPVITSATAGPGGTIDYDLDTDAPGVVNYYIDFYRSTSCDPSGHGEGEDWLASQLIVKNGPGSESYSTGTMGTVSPGDFITLTAKAYFVGPTLYQTSEFSKCFEVTGQTFLVNSTADPGDGTCDASCTLRDAITAANATSVSDEIDFNIGGGGLQTISLTSGPLPVVSNPVVIDGTTQPGAPANQPRIELSRGTPGFATATGLTIIGGKSVVRGLIVNGWTQGIGIALSGGGGNTVTGNYIGTDSAGGFGAGKDNQTGIVIQGGSTGNRIGGTTPADANLIAYQGTTSGAGSGIRLGSDANLVQGNTVFASAGFGIRVPGSHNTIGGTAAGARNVVSGNQGGGVSIDGNGNRLRGNYIGVDATGAVASPNATGVYVSGNDNLLGGNVAGAGNVISGNALTGIDIEGGSGSLVRGNRIGTDATGAFALGNDSGNAAPTYGVIVNGASGTEIGGTAGTTPGGSCTGACNVISDNEAGGVLVSGASAAPTRLLGNYIGTGQSGLSALGNHSVTGGGDGIMVVSGARAVIGAAAAGAANVIAGNDGSGIELATDSNVVKGNIVGLGADGSTMLDGSIPLGNATGIAINGGSSNQVGGTTAAARNLISNSTSYGITIADSGGSGGSSNVVVGNYVGLDATGTQDRGNGAAGIFLANSPANTIDDNVISGNSGAGIDMNTSANAIRGNFIGTTADGNGALGNSGYGIFGSGDNNTIGGVTAGDRNVISGNTGTGLTISGNSTTIQGNFIGFGSDGETDVGNGAAGIDLGDATDTVIGGAPSSPGGAPGNIIGFNAGPGIWIHAALPAATSTGATIRGNLVGVSGSNGSAPNQIGVLLEGDGVSGNSIGNPLGTGDANVISASGGGAIGGNGAGIQMSAGAHNNTVVGNRIGTTVDGVDERPNGQGILIESGSTANTIGGGSASLANTIAGNNFEGVAIDAADGNTVQGNRIGSNVNDDPLPNDIGVQLTGGATNNKIGGASSSFGNDIAFSDDTNILIAGGDDNSIRFNTISDSAGEGIRILSGSTNHVLDSTIDGNSAAGIQSAGTGTQVLRNTISSNGGDGVEVLPGTSQNMVTGNHIHGNDDLGIDLVGGAGETAAGVTPNDVGDGDTGANDLQNFADITTVDNTGSTVNVTFRIDSAPGNYDVELFSSSACDSSGNGEGETPLTIQNVANGTPTTVDVGSVASGFQITATATDASGNTSEFSACKAVPAANPVSANLTLGTTANAVNAGAQSVPIGDISLSALTQGTATTTGAPLSGIPLSGIPLTGIPLSGIPLTGIGLTDTVLNSALGGVHLSDIPLDRVAYPGGWTAKLATTTLANLPLNSVTLADVVRVAPGALTGISIGQVNLRSSPLSGIPLSGIALGAAPLSGIPLTGIGSNLQRWCDAIALQPGFTCTSASTLANETVMSEALKGLPLDKVGLDAVPLTGIPLTGIPLSGIPLTGIRLAGTPLSGIPLSGIPLTGIPLMGIPLSGINFAASPLSGIPLTGIPLTGIGATASPLSGIPLSGIPLTGISAIVDCSGGYCATHTLGQAADDHRLLANATLGQLVALLSPAQKQTFLVGDIRTFGNRTLADLVDFITNSNLTLRDLIASLPPNGNFTLRDILAVLIGAGGYDWSRLNLAQVPIADFSSDGGVITYQAQLSVSGGVGVHSFTLNATLPSGGRYIAGSATLRQGANPATPITPILTGNQLSFTGNVLTGQPYTVQWNVRAGLDLGSFPANASLSASGLASAVLAAKTVTVGQTFDTTPASAPDDNDNPATAPILGGGKLYVSHLTPGDTDYFRIPVGAFGSSVNLTLSHIATGTDYDMVAAGPQAPRLRSAPLTGIPLTNTQLPDTSVDLNQRAQALPPETLQDVPTNALTATGQFVRGVSDNRGNADEHITLISQGESGFYTVQISDFNGTSNTPYVLEVDTSPTPDLGPCSPRSLTNTSAAPPAPVVNANTNTLFLVDEARLRSTYPAAAVNTLFTKLNTLAGRSDVNGAVVRVEAGPGVAAAYGLWDQVPCSPQRANDVVRAIGSYLDTLQSSAPNLRYVVMVGGDDIVPFGRVPDETRIANEATYRESLGTTNNEYLGSIGAGFLFTDDVYAARNAPQFLGHELFVPQLATGRLVETPADMSKTIDNFTGANGTLTPTSSLVTGYDFLTDGAQSINQPFAAGFGANAKTLISATWDRTALLNAFFPTSGPVPTLNSLNAHFDHHRLLPAAQNGTTPTPAQLVQTGDVTSRGANATNNRLGFSVGCHSGLVVSDAVFSAQPILASDWGQAMLSTGAAGWIGNTGYGLGDTTEVAYSERLHALFARKLDGSMTVGQALGAAKQDYVGTLGVVTDYDAKVVMEATLYGLPMLRLGPGIPPVAPPPPPLHTDPATNLQAAAFDVTPAFTPVTTTAGKYYRADDGVQATPRRPLEPLTSLDVTQPGTAVAHGALLRLLTSPADESPFNAVFSKVTTDQAADEFDLVGVTAFPSKIQSISSFTGVNGLRQRLNLIVGAFSSSGPTLDGIGTQRRFTRAAGDVFYSASSDWTPPSLGELDTTQIATGIGFGLDVTDQDQAGNAGTVKAVVVLYRDCTGSWRTANLAPTAGARWSGGGAIATGAGCTTIDYYAQAVDAAGNVAVSSNKVQVAPLTPPPSSPDVTGSTAGPSQNGWFTNTVTVTLTSGDPVQYSLDGAPYQPYSAPFTVGGDGVHTVQAQTPSGATSYLTFGIDKTPPAIVINTPLQGATYALGQQVRASFSCTDAGSGVRSGCAGTVANGALIDTATLGTKSFTVSAATDAVGNTAAAKTVTYTVAYRKVLFSSLRDGNGGEIYSLNPNGSVNRLTTNPAIDSVPMYSPDGQRILFSSSRTGNGDIYAMNTDGTGVVQLTNSPGIEALGAYSPDGKKIVYTSTKDGNVELYAMNADGTNQTRLTTNPAWDANPVFSPDGTKVAFTSNRTSNNYDIYVAPFTTTVAGGKTVYGLGSATRLTTANGIDGEASWSSAGIAFTSSRDGNAEIYTMTPTGGSQTRRTSSSGIDSTAAWSVDGKQLVFSSNRSGSAGFDIYSMTVPATGLGTGVTRLTTHAAFDGTPAW